MRELGLKYVLLKQPDGSCIYLDGTRKCGIYESRPETCKKYSCVNLPFALSPLR
jgi:Fe-S-cluster containining protein